MAGKKKRGSGGRGLSQQVRTAGKRSSSSTRWLKRQLNDPYVAAAKRAGYRSRAAFKLAEIDDRHRLLRPGLRVVDLGAAPGGWSQVAADRVKAAEGRGQVIAIDLLPMDPIPGVEAVFQDFTEPGAPGAIRTALRDGRADVVLSDMASPATGHRQTDHLRIVALCEAALDFAEDVLAPGGAFLAKVFQGGAEQTVLRRLKTAFASVRHVKPEASRAESAEVYVLAQGFRGLGPAEAPRATCVQ